MVSPYLLPPTQRRDAMWRVLLVTIVVAVIADRLLQQELVFASEDEW